MPTIEVDYKDFERLLGTKLHRNLEKLNDILAFVKGEVKLFEEEKGIISFEIKDTNRPDIWNVEGLARTVRGFLGVEEGLREYCLRESLGEVHVDPRLKGIRPYIGCSIVKNLELTDVTIRGFMHLQDKLDQSYGRNRQRTSIGLYDFSLITLPLHYTVSTPTQTSFTPLGSPKKITLKKILEQHPKGIEYGHLVRKHSVYPILLDSEKKVLSFPPIINSNDLGRITEQTKHVLIEVTGTQHETVLKTLTIVTLSLIDRGGEAHPTTILYPHDNLKVVTPKLETSYMNLRVDHVNKMLGLRLTAEKIEQLLNKAGFNIKKLGKDSLNVQIPSYRIDVMHPVDLVEDIAISYGYNNIKPLWRRLPTTGSIRPSQEVFDVARELMVGLGYQEVLTYTLSNPENLFRRMNLNREKTVEIANPKVQTMTCLRNWLLPSLMEILSNNLHVEYPQKIFELATVTLPDKKAKTKTNDEERLAAVVSHANASFSESKSSLEALFTNLGLEWKLEETKHPSFIEGRVGTVIIGEKEIGLIGEIHPKVLESWKLENPVSSFEFNVNSIVKTKQT